MRKLESLARLVGAGRPEVALAAVRMLAAVERTLAQVDGALDATSDVSRRLAGVMATIATGQRISRLEAAERRIDAERAAKLTARARDAARTLRAEIRDQLACLPEAADLLNDDHTTQENRLDGDHRART